jgi:tetratricopeptide (TPR) repeat protein
MMQTFQRGPRTGWIVILSMLALTPLSCRADGQNTAERALMLGRVDEAATILHARIAANPRDGAAHLLLCRAFYAQELPNPAVKECETALENGLAGNSQAQDWMGRAYGRKADNAGPFEGLKLAGKVKNAFETAVQLDPANGPAANDLSEYYVGAPAIVGGGLDKATALADRVAARLPQPSHRIRALVAEKKKDYATAEREFRAAVSVAGRADAWTDLGDFYSRRKQNDQAVAALRKALEVNTAKDASLVDVASVLYTMHREPQMAEHALREYLASNAKTDAAPAFRAHYQLGQWLSADGDRLSANKEYSAALGLASNYEPARKALQAQ